MRSLQRDLKTFGALLAIHIGALAVFLPGTFSWSAVGVAVGLYYLTGAIGICLGFHRLVTHRSLRVPRALECAFAFCGTLSLQGGPIEWVSTHRAHHAHTDKPGDPHDAHFGFMWTHIEWLYRRNKSRLSLAEQHRLAPDLVNDPFYRFLEKTPILWQTLLGVLLFAIGGLPWLVWGIFVRLVLTYHITWFVNSAAHMSGYQTFRTGDFSRNNWWVGLLAWGEGWHNNHHAFPFSARHGLKWFEFDLTWLTVRFLQMVRLARDVKLPTPAMMKRLALQPERAKTG